MLSQFEDLQQCYLRLRKSGKTPAAAAEVPVSPFQQDAAELGSNEPPSKRIKQEHQAQSPAGSTPAMAPPRDGSGAEAGVSPAEPSVAVAAAPQVGCHLHGDIAAQMCAVFECTQVD